MDPRYIELAQLLCSFSIRLQPQEKLLIDAGDVPREAVLAIVKNARQRGAIPFVNLRDAAIQREIIREGSVEAFEMDASVLMRQMEKMDAYIGLRGSHNIFESSDVPPEQMANWSKAMKPVLDYRVQKTKWVVLRWPTPSMAQQAMMSTDAFTDFYFRVCTLDYSRMTPGMAALKAAMESTDRVRIKGPGTDLSFSIKGMKAITCGGHYNIPDGEVFTAPIKDSVNGTIQYNAPTVYQGVSFDNIRLVFENGRITEATSNNTDRLNAILDQDEGARYVGEFAIGFNPHITEPMRDILFDEKIAGSFHFTPGQAYEEADNGNRSRVHWDMVCIQRPEYGGGEIYFDDECIRKDGRFLLDPLTSLNPERLLA